MMKNNKTGIGNFMESGTGILDTLKKAGKWNRLKPVGANTGKEFDDLEEREALLLNKF